MAVGAQLGERGITPESIETTCDITFENLTLTKSALTTKVTARGADKAKIEEAAAAAKAGCPISKVLKTRDRPRVENRELNHPTRSMPRDIRVRSA